jgi:hypothetical protein
MIQFLSVMLDMRKDDPTKLHLGKISGSEQLPDFPSLKESVVSILRGTAGQPKMGHYGWIPSIFQPHAHPDHGRYGLWRTAQGEIDAISCLVADIDNEKPNPKVTWNDVVANAPWTMFGYDSFSGTPTNPRFRVVIETNRYMTRVEVRKVSAWLNKHAFGFQNDMSMPDRAHYAIAPDHRATVYDQQGAPLDVDWVVGQADAEIAAGCPYLTTAAASRSTVTAPTPITMQTVALMATSAQLSHNPTSWVSAGDLAEYANPDGGHWRAMFVALQRAWKRSGGVLSQGDMMTIARHIDSAASNYFINKYGYTSLQKRVKDAMKAPVIQLNRKQRHLIP